MYDIPTGLIVDHNNDTAFCKGCRCNKDLCEFEIAPKKIRLALKCKECRDVEAERNRKHRLNKTLGNTKPQLKRTGEERAPKIDLDSRKLPPNFKMSDYSSKDHPSKELEYDGKLIKYCQSCKAFHELCHFIDPKSNVENTQCNLQREAKAIRNKTSYHNNIEEINERRRERYAENPVEANERNKKYRTPERLQQYNANRRRKHAENPEHNRDLRREYHQNNKERINVRDREYYRVNKDRIRGNDTRRRKTQPKTRYAMIVNNAKARDLDFDLTLEAATVLMESPCFYCNYKVDEELISIDRLDSHKGYNVDNVGILEPLDKDVCRNVYRNTTGSKYTDCKSNAKDRKLDFELTYIQHTSIVALQCYYCNRNNTRLHKNGIDRLDSKIGYVAGNCVACCTDCNLLKGTLTENELYKQASAILENTEDRDLHMIDHIPKELNPMAPIR